MNIHPVVPGPVLQAPLREAGDLGRIETEFDLDQGGLAGGEGPVVPSEVTGRVVGAVPLGDAAGEAAPGDGPGAEYGATDDPGGGEGRASLAAAEPPVLVGMMVAEQAMRLSMAEGAVVLPQAGPGLMVQPARVDGQVPEGNSLQAEDAADPVAKAGLPGRVVEALSVLAPVMAGGQGQGSDPGAGQGQAEGERARTATLLATSKVEGEGERAAAPGFALPGSDGTTAPEVANPLPGMDPPPMDDLRLLGGDGMARGMVEGARAGLPLLATAPPPGFWGISRLVAEVQAHPGEPKIEVIVPSAEIGALRMEIVTEGDALRMVLMVERPETVEMVRRHLDQLRAELAGLGFSSADLSFGSWDGARAERHKSGSDTAELYQVTTEDTRNFAQPGDPAMRGRHIGGLDLRL